MSSRLIAFVVWAAVAASAVFWGLRLLAQSPQAPAHAKPVLAGAAARGDLSRVLGADTAPAAAAAAPAQQTRFQLLGVVAPKTAAPVAEGLALIGTDGKPAKAYKVGAVVEGDTVLQSVQHRSVALGPRGQPPAIQLELAPMAPPATGTLPAAAAGPVAAPPMPSGLPVARPLGSRGPQPVQGMVPAPQPVQLQVGENPGGPDQGQATLPQTR